MMDNQVSQFLQADTITRRTDISGCLKFVCVKAIHFKNFSEKVFFHIVLFTVLYILHKRTWRER